MTPPKAKDGSETLQESRTYLLWINKNDQHFAVRILDNGTAVVEGELAPKEAMEVFVTEAQKQRDAAQAEIARLESDNTRLRMKLLAAEFDANIPADVRTPLPVAEDVEEQIKQAFESFLQDIISCVTAGYRLGFEYQRERMFRELILPLLRQPEAAPGGWQLVPKTPDENMIRAYKGAVKEYIQSLPESERQHTKTARGGYPVPERIKATVRFAAMLASAPKPATPASAGAGDFEDRLKELFGCEIIAGANTIGDLRKLTAKIVALHFEALASTPAPASAQDELVKAHEIAAEAVWALAGGFTGTSLALKNADPVSLQTVDGPEEFGDGWFVVNRPIMVVAGLLPATGGAK